VYSRCKALSLGILWAKNIPFTLNNIQQPFKAGRIGEARQPAARVLNLTQIFPASFEIRARQLDPAFHPSPIRITLNISRRDMIRVQHFARDVVVSHLHIVERIAQHVRNMCAALRCAASSSNDR
jgi:hypothetical protein